MHVENLCGKIETLHGKVERVSNGSGGLDSRNIGIRASAEEYLGTGAGRNSPPHVCREEGQPNLVGGYTYNFSRWAPRRMIVLLTIHPPEALTRD